MELSHIYKYDSTGKFVGKVTEGAWNVTEAEMDSTRSTLFVRGSGREANTFKGHTKLYRMRPDGSALALLTPETGDHTTTISPNGRFFVDTYSSTNVPPVTVVRSTDNGRVIRELERTDISTSTSLGWKPIEIHTLTASDGAPLYAAVYKPTNFDSTKRYPVVDHIYPMPLGAIRGWSFIGPSSEQQALAELGFIVLQIQPRGVRDPSPAIRNYYRTQYQGRYAEATLADHVEAIKQLGARFSWIDLDKVGLYGTSGGGLSTTVGMLRYPDFFKVGVAFAGNHDDRSEHTIVGESWRGMLQKDSTGKDNYEGDANYLLVNNLRGKLMLVHGDLDEAVHPVDDHSRCRGADRCGQAIRHDGVSGSGSLERRLVREPPPFRLLRAESDGLRGPGVHVYRRRGPAREHAAAQAADDVRALTRLHR